MKNLPIVGKILAILGVFGLFVVVVTGYVTHQMRSIDTGYKNLRGGETAALIGLLRANGALEIMRAEVGELRVNPAASGNQTSAADVPRLRAHVAQFMGQAVAAYPQDAAEMQLLKSRGEQLVNGECGDPGQLTAMAAADGGGATMQTEFLTKCVPQFATMSSDIVAEINRVAAGENTQFSSLTAMTSGTILTTIGLILVGLVLMVLGGFFAARSWISVPVKALQGVMGRLSGGDLQTKVLGVERKDEIGGMARAVQVFKDAGLEKVGLEEGATAVAAQVRSGACG